MNKINLEFLKAANRYACEQTGEPVNIISMNNLLQAIGIQDNNYYDNDDQIACAVLRSLIIGHGFEQGNKRTAFAAIKYMNPPTCPDTLLQDVILSIASPGGSKISVEYLETLLYN